MIVDSVTDNGDNSLTIIGHIEDGTEYSSGMGRKSDIPTKQADQMAYYVSMLNAALPPTQPILYQTPEYAQKLENEADTAIEVDASQTSVD